MKTKTKASTSSHAALAKEMRVSRSYFSRLARSGMPATSVKAAREWIAAKAQETGTGKAAPTSLNEARMNKLLLETALLQLRYEREASNAEFLPVTTVTAGARGFMTWARIYLRINAQAMVDGLVAASTAPEVTTIIRQFADGGFIAGVYGALTSTEAFDERMDTAFKYEFKGFFEVSPEEIDAEVEDFRKIIKQMEGKR